MVLKYPSGYDDEFINIIKEMIDHIKVHGKAIQDLVAEGQLTEEQYSNLITTVNGMIKSGEVDKSDLTPELRAEVDKVRNKIDKGEVSIYDINKNKGKFDQTYMSDELLQQMAGDAPVNAVPADGSLTNIKYARRSISADKTDFMTPSPNIFNGNYLSGLALNNLNTPGVIEYDNGVMAIIPAEGNATYHVRKFEYSDRFKIGTAKTHPSIGDTLNNGHLNLTESQQMHHALTTEADEQYIVVHVSSTNQRPLMHITKDADYDEFVEYTPTINAKIEDLPDNIVDSRNVKDRAIKAAHVDFTVQSANIFTGDYIEGLTINTWDSPRVVGVESAVSAIIPVDGDAVYHIRKFESSDRLRVGLTTAVKAPEVGDDLTTLVSAHDGANYAKVETATDDKWMVVGVSNSGQKPLMHITKDADYTTYIPPVIFDSKKIGMDQDENTEANRRKFFVLGEPGIYLGEANTIDPNGKDLNYFQTIYDNLESSPLVTSEVEGQDDLGNDIKSYTIEKPYPEAVYYSGYDTYPLDYSKRNKMKIVIIGGVHGNEKTSQVGLSNFLKDLVEDTEDKSLEFIRNNLILKVIPLANPSGIDANTRENHNGVDLNRDYIDQSQNEIRIVANYISENKDALALLDYHDSARTISFWPAEENQIYHDIFYTVMANINDHWTKDNPIIKNPVGEIVINPTNTNSQTFAHNLGMLGITVETMRNFNSINSGVDWTWNATAVKYGNDLLINTILTIMKYYS